ncbi:hypothetical protein ACH4E7_30570 [Kitasatospora sp. NPDC018058]|uniref:hypothetical protein n=1 Tax=Kitasatospora sp. NPDC018058 TaxID=3364025 RepID=UPI0037C1420B
MGTGPDRPRVERTAVTIEVSWACYDRSGAAFQRPRVFYFLARTPDGWRITTSAVLAD